ncbi:MAG TPA: 16S rRNA (adenine(1518)-N(6)/adenine(1519)-N(6))-dimethyltransferase RsmA [Candidatus Acidoferrales bacterium]|jgi:16S rRNA (adenine1518-N6/adenine1519-N6)-dimethyltransferase|nr:16S rRNA (adenine(1518)-N(6)/adenine(1519)-N(6))-dimethyltransferase RsmA [Candidatus Acidoferrales bacterium]
MSRQRLGQHFLHDLGWRKRILATLPLAANQTWIEIGPGHGEMTQLLVGEGRRIIAIETDQRLAEGLRAARDNDTAQWPGLEIVTADVLATNIGDLATSTIHVYGNLPYYITSPILHHLFRWATQIASIHIVVQLEVAERIAAHPDVRDYGYLSAVCQFYAQPRIALRLPPGAFRPPPKVKSALLSMTLPGAQANLNIVGTSEERNFLGFVQTCFSQKRKTLRNNLLAISTDKKIHEALGVTALRPDARAEQLSLPQFAALFAQLAR